MTFDPRTHELVARIIQPDGSYVDEIRERATPIELGDHHDYHDAKWVIVRKERDRLLAETDWLVTKASETGRPVPQEWRDYRQALRDITSQENPFFLTWPTKPAAPTPMAPSTTQTPDEEII